MKKVNIDLMLGRRTECLTIKLSPKDNIIHSVLPAAQAGKGSSLSLGPILTRYALDANSVYGSFNDETMNWLSGIKIPLTITSTSPKNFTLETKSPSIYTIINLIWPFSITTRVLQIQKTLLIASLFKAAIVKANQDLYVEDLNVRKRFFEKRIKNAFSQAIGTFKSFRVFSYFRRKTKRIYKGKNKSKNEKN